MIVLSKLLFVLFLAAYGPTVLASGQHIIARSIYEDKTAQMTFEQVRNQEFQPVGELYFKGYTHSAYWLKLRIDPRPHEIGPEYKGLTDGLILRILPSYLDEITLYDPLELPPRVRTVGDYFPWLSNEFPSLNFTFIIPAGNTPRDVWVRIKTTSTHMASVEAHSIDEFLDIERIQEITFGIWLGVLITMFLWALGIWLVDRDPLVGFFVINQFSVTLHALVIMGYFRLFLSPAFSVQTIGILSNVIILTFVFVAVIFFYRFNREFKIKKWVHYMFWSILVLYPLNLALLATNHTMQALHLNALSVTVLAFCLIAIPLVGIDWKQNHKPIITKPTMMIVNGLFFLVALINSLPLLGIAHTLQAAPYAGMTLGLVTGAIFLLVLQHRFRMLKEVRLSEVSRAEALAQVEISKRLEQEKFLTMLTHELKTPLSVLLLAYGSNDGLEKYKNHIGVAIKDMQNVIDRCVMADKFENTAISSRIDTFSLNDLIVAEIDKNFPSERFDVSADQDYLIQTDEYLLNTVLTNLFDNALKYGDENQNVQVRVHSTQLNGQPHVNIQISNALGRAGRPDPNKVFDKYYRAPLAYQKTGSGLGLFLVKKIMTTLNGRLLYKPTEQGVTFEITLPVSDFAHLRALMNDAHS